MGAGVSGWRLARAVSETGQLGVVSGTALDVILARRLQLGDPGGSARRALESFPLREVAERILDRYFIPGGKGADEPFRPTPFATLRPSRNAVELLVASNFAEVFLAKEGHEGPVGINYLEKIQLPTLPSLFGAMLAGVSWILMGAGIPRTIPGVLDRLAVGEPVELKVNVAGANGQADFCTRFDPEKFFQGCAPSLARPGFLPIVSSATLAGMLAKKSTGRVDGFVVELPTAGGHNAPPRGKLQLTPDGQPIYGERDVPDLAAMRALGLPFWLAGSFAEPERLAEAITSGASGVQVGTAFAYCEESDLDPDLKRRVLAISRTNGVEVYTDPLASPTGFPFKVVHVEGTLSEQPVYEGRTRVCDLAYLRHAFVRADGSVGWRCPAEPKTDFLAKGGEADDMRGRKCICNALMANIGLGQVQRGGVREAPLITSGNDATRVARFLRPGAESYRARDVIDYLLHDAGSAGP
jgi:nitronate monooxygenase